MVHFVLFVGCRFQAWIIAAASQMTEQAAAIPRKMPGACRMPNMATRATKNVAGMMKSDCMAGFSRCEAGIEPACGGGLLGEICSGVLLRSVLASYCYSAAVVAPTVKPQRLKSMGSFENDD
jgi:hypothetical protein